MSLDIAEEKWFRKAIAGFKKVWVPMVQAAESFDAFVKGIAAVTGLPEGVIRASLPAQNWAEFQRNASRYLPKAVAKIEAAFRAKKWSRKYRQAWQAPGT